MDTTRFDGEFVPPSLGPLRWPVAIAGKGAIELDAEGLRATGFASRSAWLALPAFLVTAAAAICGAYVVMHSVFHMPFGSSGVALGLATGAVGAIATPRGATTTPVEQRWRWSAVVKSDLAGSPQDPKKLDRVVVTMLDGRRNRTLHFRPTGNPGALYAAIESTRG